jgi:hypothetical protein
MVAPAVIAAIPAIVEWMGKIIDKVVPDPNEAAKIMKEVAVLEQQGELARMAAEVDLGKAQADVNAVEAASDDKFKSRWRPAIGWVCAAGLAYQFLFRPLLIVGLVIADIQIDYDILDLDIATLTTIVFGMLGLGFYRTVEKSRGIA